MIQISVLTLLFDTQIQQELFEILKTKNIISLVGTILQ